MLERLLRRDGSNRAHGLTIAPMRRRDLRSGVMNIEIMSYPRPWSKAVFESEIDQMKSGTRHYVVARRDRSVVGYAGLWFTADEAHVTNVAVHPDSLRTGVATHLMLDLADESMSRGAAAWTLEVRASSVGAQDLYRRFGFAPAGVRKQYYENIEDAIVMWCNDIQGDAYAELLASIRTERS